MRRDKPSRHGRAADALIASYLRELSSDEGPSADMARPDAPLVGSREGEGAPLALAPDVAQTDGRQPGPAAA